MKRIAQTLHLYSYPPETAFFVLSNLMQAIDF